VIREIVQGYLQYVGFEADEYPPSLQFKSFEPSTVVVNPFRAAGQPVFADSGTLVANVAGMLRAGEDSGVVAEEHGIGIGDVRAADRVLLRRAA
jgi:uncharacterized protein (DUF433 family)